MSAVRDTLGGAVHAWRRLRYRRALARQRVRVPRGEVRVSYGQVLPPAAGRRRPGWTREAPAPAGGIP